MASKRKKQTRCLTTHSFAVLTKVVIQQMRNRSYAWSTCVVSLCNARLSLFAMKWSYLNPCDHVEVNELISSSTVTRFRGIKQPLGHILLSQDKVISPVFPHRKVHSQESDEMKYRADVTLKRYHKHAPLISMNWEQKSPLFPSKPSHSSSMAVWSYRYLAPKTVQPVR